MHHHICSFKCILPRYTIRLQLQLFLFLFLYHKQAFIFADVHVRIFYSEVDQDFLVVSAECDLISHYSAYCKEQLPSVCCSCRLFKSVTILPFFLRADHSHIAVVRYCCLFLHYSSFVLLSSLFLELKIHMGSNTSQIKWFGKQDTKQKGGINTC